MVPGADMAGKKGTGGAPSHKDPECPCAACTRRRQTKAVAVSAGAGGSSVAPVAVDETAVISADLPMRAEYVRQTPRSRIAEWLAMRTLEPDLTNAECARRMGINRTSLQAHISRAVKEGWLQFDEPISRVEHELIPKALDTLSHFLDKKDKTVAMETAKNTIFKQYLEAKGIRDAPTTILALKIESTPVDSDVVPVMTGHIVGVARG